MINRLTGCIILRPTLEASILIEIMDDDFMAARTNLTRTNIAAFRFCRASFRAATCSRSPIVTVGDWKYNAFEDLLP
jgi:hypothetical protein